MAINDLTLPSYQELQQQGHTNVGQQDVPRLSAIDMQRLLDYVPCEVLLPAFNNLITELQASTAGADIGVSVGGMAADNVADAFAEVLVNIGQVQGGLPPLGTTGQFLSKRSDNNFDVEWADAGAGDMTKAVYDPQNINADAFAAANNTIADAGGYYNAGNVEGALQEIGASGVKTVGGTFSGAVQGMASPDAATAQFRNIVVAAAGTDPASLTVPAGTIICVLK